MNTVTVHVQACITSGIPCFNVVGLPDKIINESKERVRASLASIGVRIPSKRITINLSPAGLTKIGTHYDLPIAISIINLIKSVEFSEDINKFIIMGELALDGTIKGVSGVLPASIYACSKSLGIICSSENGKECLFSRNNNAVAVGSLMELMEYLQGNIAAPFLSEDENVVTPELHIDMSQVRGQSVAKRAVEIACAGGHNVLMRGPPGTGKSMIAKRMPTILPDLSPNEKMEVKMIESISGNFKDVNSFGRPFRAPHHSASVASIVGGGPLCKPGEVTLAHNGMLFLDEFPEFQRNVIDCLRQIMDSGQVSISRARSKVTYPALFQFVAAMNPCRCGYLGYYPDKECRNSSSCGANYSRTISGPILDRIDIFVNMSKVQSSEIFTPSAAGEESQCIKQRIIKARDTQAERYQKKNFSLNAQVDAASNQVLLVIEGDAIDFLLKASDSEQLSMRSYDRILRVARTIADLEGSYSVRRIHVSEALYYKLNF